MQQILNFGDFFFLISNVILFKFRFLKICSVFWFYELTVPLPEQI